MWSLLSRGLFGNCRHTGQVVGDCEIIGATTRIHLPVACLLDVLSGRCDCKGKTTSHSEPQIREGTQKDEQAFRIVFWEKEGIDHGKLEYRPLVTLHMFRRVLLTFCHTIALLGMSHRVSFELHSADSKIQRIIALVPRTCGGKRTSHV